MPTFTKEQRMALGHIDRTVLLMAVLTLFNGGYPDRLYSGTFRKHGCASTAHIDRLGTHALAIIGSNLVTDAMESLPEVLADTAWKNLRHYTVLDTLDGMLHKDPQTLGWAG